MPRYIPQNRHQNQCLKTMDLFFWSFGDPPFLVCKNPAEASFLRWHPARRPKWKVIIVLVAGCLIDNWSVKGSKHFGCYCLMEEVVIKPYLKTVILCKSIDAGLFPSTVWMFEMCFYLYARLDSGQGFTSRGVVALESWNPVCFLLGQGVVQGNGMCYAPEN